MSVPVNVSENASEPLVIWYVNAGSGSPNVLVLASALTGDQSLLDLEVLAHERQVVVVAAVAVVHVQ